jgi:hypothetical protein
VVVHRGQVGLGFGGDHAQGGCIEAMPHQQVLGGVEDAGAGVGFHGWILLANDGLKQMF